MAEATTPATGVPQAQPSLEQRMQALYAREAQEQAEPEAQESAPSQEPAQEGKPAPAEDTAAPTDELTPEDLPDDSQTALPPVADGVFEIVHNGTQHKLSREETIKYAQQGFDYTQKTQALSEKAKALEGALQRASEIEQLAPLIANEQATVAALGKSLEPYKNVDWIRLATDSPLDYPKYRAQYDSLVAEYNAAAYRVQQGAQEIGKRRQEITATNLRQEFARLQELVPEWKDPDEYKKGSAEVQGYLLKQGAAPEAVASLADALAVSIARKAMLYDKLVASKREKSKLLQTAPPVARPGVANTASSAAEEKQQALAKKFKRSGTVEDAAALYLTRMK